MYEEKLWKNSFLSIVVGLKPANLPSVHSFKGSFKGFQPLAVKVGFHRSPIFVEYLSMIASIAIVIKIITWNLLRFHMYSRDHLETHQKSYFLLHLYILPLSLFLRKCFEYLSFLYSFYSNLSCWRSFYAFFYEMVESNCYFCWKHSARW